MKPNTLREQLAEIHQAVADDILDGLRAEDPKDRRQATALALQLLKQNGITAPPVEGSAMDQLRSRMAGKLDFSTLEAKTKVVPIRREPEAA
jgi:hypothetical protein